MGHEEAQFVALSRPETPAGDLRKYSFVEGLHL